MPLPVHLSLSAANGWASVVGVLVAGWGFFRIRMLTGSWLLPKHQSEDTQFKWRYTLPFVLASMVVVPLGSVAWTMWSVEYGIRTTTSGFVMVDGEGIQIAHRVYERDGREVHLIGMMHIGEADVYDGLFGDLPVDGTVLLSEGVSDRKGVLSAQPKYDGVAGSLGLTHQQPMSTMTEIEERNADIDVSEFSDTTLDLLTAVLSVHSAGEGNTVVDAIDGVEKVMKDSPDKVLAGFIGDLIDRRNQHLLGELDEALEDYERVVVPWGAYHMKGIEEGILARGFQPVAGQQRTFARWTTLRQGLTRALRG